MAQAVIKCPFLCQAAEHEAADRRIDSYVDATEVLKSTRGRNRWRVNVKSSSEPRVILSTVTETALRHELTLSRQRVTLFLYIYIYIQTIPQPRKKTTFYRYLCQQNRCLTGEPVCAKITLLAGIAHQVLLFYSNIEINIRNST